MNQYKDDYGPYRRRFCAGHFTALKSNINNNNNNNSNDDYNGNYTKTVGTTFP